ncbi:hypothetical protein NQ314_003289 [Rhamnusium bicolor]|uniref:DDE Tnp4 domain-containing protein n=1 Tax=Rhamnusium bicolor TaxID=1586634 RepID=A0AAV8ZM29_9CUCU|nr:hypothetical protein NQ314_003289 [Rhamnusium bicolor]
MSDIEIAAGAFAVLSVCNYIPLQKRQRRRRRWWVITLHRFRNQYDGRQLLSHLIQEPSGQFDNFCRMSSTDFEYLQVIEPKIKKERYFLESSYTCKGLADSDYNFLFADIGSHGRMSDGGVFNDSLLYHKIQNNENFPEATCFPGRKVPVPYVFVADAAFALSDRIMKTYPGVPP